MIALRRRLERAARHPLLGPLVILLLVLLVALTIVHGTHDQIAEEGIACIAIAFALLSLVLPLVSPPQALLTPSVTSRGPPANLRAALAEAPVVSSGSAPLRL